MLSLEHQKRPSVETLCKNYSNFISLITFRKEDEMQKQLNDDLFFLKSKYLLGTDVPGEEALRYVRWDKGFPGGTLETGALQLQRLGRLIEARKTILGADHPNTI